MESARNELNLNFFAFHLIIEKIRYNFGLTQHQGLILHNWSVWAFISCILVKKQQFMLYFSRKNFVFQVSSNNLKMFIFVLLFTKKAIIVPFLWKIHFIHPYFFFWTTPFSTKYFMHSQNFGSLKKLCPSPELTNLWEFQVSLQFERPPSLQCRSWQ